MICSSRPWHFRALLLFCISFYYLDLLAKHYESNKVFKQGTAKYMLVYLSLFFFVVSEYGFAGELASYINSLN